MASALTLFARKLLTAVGFVIALFVAISVFLGLALSDGTTRSYGLVIYFATIVGIMLSWRWIENRRAGYHRLDAQNIFVAVTLANTKQHMPVLVRKRHEAVVPDEYGIVDMSEWKTQVDGFLSRVVIPNLLMLLKPSAYKSAQLSMLRAVYGFRAVNDPDHATYMCLGYLVDREVNQFIKANPAPADEYATPREFEMWCAEQLKRKGWHAQLTGRAGDQGVDVLATKGMNTLVVQCKFYEGPAGNDSVQQIFAGKRFYRGTQCVVVATNGFTKSARALAAQTNTLLLCPTELRSFDM